MIANRKDHVQQYILGKRVMDHDIQRYANCGFQIYLRKPHIILFSNHCPMENSILQKNLFMSEFRLGTAENRKGHSEKRANLHR